MPTYPSAPSARTQATRAVQAFPLWRCLLVAILIFAMFLLAFLGPTEARATDGEVVYVEKSSTIWYAGEGGHEGIDTTNNRVVFCVESSAGNRQFGNLRRYNIVGRSTNSMKFSQNNVTEIALMYQWCLDHQYELNNNGTSDGLRHYRMFQYFLWDYTGYVACGNLDAWKNMGSSGLSGDGASVNKIYDYIKANKDKYIGYGYMYSNEDGTQRTGTFWAKLNTGDIALNKASSYPELSEGNACYSLEGATYTVYGDAGCTTSVGTITTDADGYGELKNVIVGTYYVKETAAPKGYATDETCYPITVTAGNTATVGGTTITDTPQSNLVNLIIQKVDAETGLAAPLGKATLEGAEFSVAYYDADPNVSYSSEEQLPEAKRTWIFKTDAAGQIFYTTDYLASGDALYTNSSGELALPLGVVVIKETVAPTGYLLDETPRFISITSDSTQENVTSFAVPSIESPTMYEQVKRGDFEFSKVDGQTMETLAGVVFKVTSQTTGETHFVVGDENGEVKTQSSWNAHTNNTNANDAAVDADTEAYEEMLDPNAGVWFSGSAETQTEVDDSKGALPYDTYLIEEMPCKANQGYNLVKFYVVISRDNTVVDRGTVDDHSDEVPPDEEEPEEPTPEPEPEPTPAPTPTPKKEELPQTGLDSSWASSAGLGTALMGAAAALYRRRF